MYYNKNGKKITVEEWAKLLEDKDYKRIAQDNVSKYWISTIFLGLNHNFDGKTKPLIFETMVFKGKRGTIKSWSDLDCNRYSTLKEAKDGHQKMVNKWRNK